MLFVVDTIERLSNVQRLHLHRECHQSHGGMNLKHPTWPLLADVWPTIGPRLHFIFLDMPLTRLIRLHRVPSPDHTVTVRQYSTVGHCVQQGWKVSVPETIINDNVS